MDKVKREVAEILLYIKAVGLSPNKPYRYTSGILSPIYCDNRLIMSHVGYRKRIVDIFLKTIKSHNLTFDVVGGVATSGIPFASWISYKLEKPMIYVRPKRKGHGKENVIEGEIYPGQRVIVVEDLISTGGSSASCVESIRDVGGIVEDCVAIFTYGLERAKNIFKDIGCKLLTLTDFETLLNVAEEIGYISQKEKSIIQDWRKDPDNWGRKMGFE